MHQIPPEISRDHFQQKKGALQQSLQLYIQTRIPFAMLKSILVSIHGVWEKYSEREDRQIKRASEVAFGLVPIEERYDCR